MPHPIYPWKRFWYPRSANFRLLDGGYLSDPEAEYGSIINPDAVSLEGLANTRCLVLLGEPGIGKSTVLQASHANLRIDLGSYQSDSGLLAGIFPPGLSLDEPATIALDSLDEGRLAISNIVKVLLRAFQDRRSTLDRIRLRVTCRTADWPTTFEDGLKDLWSEQNVCVYQLAPLRRCDVAVAVKANGLEPTEFVKEVDRREAVPFAIKPITLQFLINSFASRQHLPATKADLYLHGCLGLCEESESRKDVGGTGKLSAPERLAIASRIAAITMFGGFSAIWTGADLGNMPATDISVRRLSGGQERANEIDIDADETAVREALGTGLFVSQGQDQLRWSHHTYAEFLAAKYLTDRQVPIGQVMSILTVPNDKEGKITPQLNETAAWLASMRQEFFHEIMASDPSVLLLSDVTTADDAVRATLVSKLLKLYDNEKLLDSSSGLRPLYRKLSHPELHGQLRRYIADPAKGRVVRRVAIDIAEACQLSALQDDLAEVALDVSQDVHIRIQAACAIARIGDQPTKLRLKPLAVRHSPEDTQDELKGWALMATWPELLNADELFDSLTPLKDERLVGIYSHFLGQPLLDSLRPIHLPAALKWLARQRVRRELSVWLARISDRILELAWNHLDDPGVLESFVDVIVLRLKSHAMIAGDSRERSREWFASDSRKRHIIVEELVNRFVDEEVNMVVWAVPGLGQADEFAWLLERYDQCRDDEDRRKWLTLLVRTFSASDQSHLEVILPRARSDALIGAAFSPIIAVELGSEAASRMRTSYQRELAMERELAASDVPKSLLPAPAERIALLLKRFEAGDTNAWWRLLADLTLEPNSTRHGPEWEADVTALPGWKASSEETRSRIVAAARSYILRGNPQNHEWLGQPVWFRPAAAGARAFLLLMHKDPDSLDQLESPVWKKWTAALMAYPASARADYQTANSLLLQKAYAADHQEFVHVVLTLIDAESQRSDYLPLLDMLFLCWGPELAKALRDKSRDKSLKPSIVGAILGFLLQHKDPESQTLALSLIENPVPSAGRKRDLAVFAAGSLLRHAAPSNWSTAWLAWASDLEFGKAVFSFLSDRGDFQGTSLMAQLDEDALVSLYLWLLKAYPESEASPEATWRGTPDHGSWWRNGILGILQSRGTERACEAIVRLLRECPEQQYLKWSLQSAQEATRFRNWKPLSPEAVLRLARDSTKRLIRSGAELLDVLIESLNRFAQKLRGETALVSNLWNEVSKRRWRPKEEDHLSDNVKRHLEDDLRAKGVVLNREVVIRRAHGAAAGERTDIHVDALVPGTLPESRDVITAIIEVKGCWNRELWTAMETQLVGRYLHESHSKHGLYLVGWFSCPAWSSSHKPNGPAVAKEEAEKSLTEQAAALSRSGLDVRAFVLDASLR